jgi:metal-responsive CopG/Arc/MetJ family transcriptional regulator
MTVTKKPVKRPVNPAFVVMAQVYIKSSFCQLHIHHDKKAKCLENFILKAFSG